MRLIDADTLRAEFTGNFNELWHYTGVRAVIDNAPTIDAVPVIRCKDCKKWNGVEAICDWFYCNTDWDFFCGFADKR